jgi:hypothetical protein
MRFLFSVNNHRFITVSFEITFTSILQSNSFLCERNLRHSLKVPQVLSCNRNSMSNDFGVDRNNEWQKYIKESDGFLNNVIDSLIRDRLCGLVVRVPGYRTEMYCFL